MKTPRLDSYLKKVDAENRASDAKSKALKGLGANNLNPNKYKDKELRAQNKRIHEKYNR